MNQEKQIASEQPQLDRRPVPVWLFTLLLLLLYWGVVYFDLHAGWFSQEVYAPYHRPDEVAKWQPTGDTGVVELGRKIYHRPTCEVCHMVDGKGRSGQAPSLD